MTIETLTSANLVHLANLSVQLWPDCTLVQQEQSYREILDSDQSVCFLLRDESVYIGFVQLSIRNDYVEGSDSSPVPYLEGLFIIPKYRKQGLGRRLVQTAEQWSRNKGYPQIASDAEASNTTSIKFHQSIGFKEAARIVCFIKDL